MPIDLRKDNKLNNKILKIMNENDDQIQKTYLSKVSTNKSEKKSPAVKTPKRGLLVVKSEINYSHPSSIKNSRPISIDVIQNKSSVYKLPLGNRIRESIKSKLSLDAKRQSRTRRDLLSLRNEESSTEYFLGVKRKLESFSKKIKSSFPIKDAKPIRSMSKLPLYSLSNMDDGSKRTCEKDIYFTNESELTPHCFTKLPSKMDAFSKHPNFQSFIPPNTRNMVPTVDYMNNPIVEVSVNPQTITSNLKPMIYEVTKETISIAYSVFQKNVQNKSFNPIIPNYVHIDKASEGGNIMNYEDPLVVLSLLYTEVKIATALKLFTRTFSGNLLLPYRGSTFLHGLYCGNFGDVDGIHFLFDRRLSISERFLNHHEMSRESFLALSHMYNLHKLVGRPNIPIMNYISQRSRSRGSLTGSLIENVMTSRLETESVESVDTKLVQSFIDRFVKKDRVKDEVGENRISIIHKKSRLPNKMSEDIRRQQKDEQVEFIVMSTMSSTESTTYTELTSRSESLENIFLIKKIKKEKPK